MKHKMAIITAVLLAMLALCGLPARAGDPPVVQNAKTPRGTAYTLKLTEELRVGPETGDERFIWPSMASGLAVDGKGHIYVADILGARIIEIDGKGKFVRQIGRKGQGPGEFQNLMSFQILTDGRGAAFENIGIVNNFTYFDAKGNYLKKETTQGMDKILRQAALSPDDRWIAGIVVKVDQANRKTIIKSGVFDKQVAQKIDLVQFESPLPNPNRFGEADYWAEMLASQFRSPAKGLIGFTAFDAQGNLYTAVAGKYEVSKWDKNLNKTLVFGRDYERMPLTDEELAAVVEPITDQIRENLPDSLKQLISPRTVEKALELAEMPPYKNPVNGLSVMDTGHILVLHDANLPEGWAKVDIFDAEGQYVGQFTHSFPGAGRMTFKNGKAYALELNEDEENEAVRYKYELVSATVGH